MNLTVTAVLLIAMLGPLLVASLFARARGLSFREQWGTVTLTYSYPGTSAPVATTLAQYNNFNTVVGTIVAGAAGDAQQIVTHNLNLPAADISSGWPNVTLTPLSDPFGSSAGWFVASQHPDYTVLQKGTLGTGPTTRFAIASPHTITR